jgi:hypothetical protein
VFLQAFTNFNISQNGVRIANGDEAFSTQKHLVRGELEFEEHEMVPSARCSFRERVRVLLFVKTLDEAHGIGHAIPISVKGRKRKQKKNPPSQTPDRITTKKNQTKGRARRNLNKKLKTKRVEVKEDKAKKKRRKKIRGGLLEKGKKKKKWEIAFLPRFELTCFDHMNLVEEEKKGNAQSRTEKGKKKKG